MADSTDPTTQTDPTQNNDGDGDAIDPKVLEAAVAKALKAKAREGGFDDFRQMKDAAAKNREPVKFSEEQAQRYHDYVNSDVQTKLDAFELEFLEFINEHEPGIGQLPPLERLDLLQSYHKVYTKGKPVEDGDGGQSAAQKNGIPGAGQRAGGNSGSAQNAMNEAYTDWLEQKPGGKARYMALMRANPKLTPVRIVRKS